MRGSPLLSGHHHASSFPSANGWLRILLALAIALWLAFFFLMYNGLFRQEQLAMGDRCGAAAGDGEGEGGRGTEAVESLQEEVSRLRRQNKELSEGLDKGKARGKGVRRAGDGGSGAHSGYSLEHEVSWFGAILLSSFHFQIARRHLHNQIWELFYSLRGGNRLSAPTSIYGSFSTTNTIVEAEAVEDRLLEQVLSLLADSERFGSKVDKAEEWHRGELAKLTAFMQDKLHRLQHPKECEKGR